ncbi:LacI family DNA-binding transcriptional regulator [Alkalibacterium iburiense]|uniref:LacI family DNA-binding transcriptional regulator n=1 Tax=Alkalibacterium iburiense TaxID=290589 RepID=A0ABN0XB34_9LACT
MVTIKDVAEYSGVSVATVSRALNNSGYVGEKSRIKVEEAVKALGYYPNEVARSLYQKSSKMIGLLLPDISNPYFPLLAKGVEDYAQQNGYMVILGNVEDNPEKEDMYVKFFSQYNISGVLSASAGKKNNTYRVPFILLDRADEEEDYSVSTDDKLGGKLAAQAILKAGGKHAIVMAGPKNVSGANDRLSGALSILDNGGLSYKVMETNSFKVEKAEITAINLFETYESFDSVIASNDVYALAVMKEAIKRGHKIPEDIQIIGYDDMLFSRLMYPGLTTIAQPAYDVGYQGAKMLLDLIEKKTVKNKKLKLKPKLITRNSLR